MSKKIRGAAALLTALPFILGAGLPEVDLRDAEPVQEVHRGEHVVLTSVTAPDAFENLAPGQTVAWDIHVEAVDDAAVQLNVESSGDLSIETVILAADRPLEFGGEVGELTTPDTGVIGQGDPATGVSTTYGYVADAGTVRIFVTSNGEAAGESSYVVADVLALPAEAVFDWYQDDEPDPGEPGAPQPPDGSGWEDPEETRVTPPGTDPDGKHAGRGGDGSLAVTGTSVLALLLAALGAVLAGFGAVALARRRQTKTDA
ncbi:hypothetical protein [Sediminivirga luteola]|uniref:hypothetical protein n=1 Tax=Sediminivirga luteola TaxID=1774748 RepID=UPI001F56355B|nr:hypothetical protein [Sediminivirga luteola]MCI2267093.1 hypothetical protein [Sediminivirga luteola]